MLCVDNSAKSQSKPKPRTIESISVKSNAKEYKQNEPVRLVFSVINDTDTHVEIIKDQFFVPKCSAIMITGPMGAVACSIPERTTEPMPLKKLASGGYVEFEFNIAPYWDLSVPGEYKVVFYYTMSNGVSKAAPVVSFRISG
jgi:hypothetical protein